MWSSKVSMEDILIELRAIRELLDKIVNKNVKLETDFDKTIKEAFDNKPML